MRVAVARLIECGGCGSARAFQVSAVVGIGDLGGVEAGAQQERRKVGDQIADGPDLALEAVTLAQQHGEAEWPRPSPKAGKRMAIGPPLPRAAAASAAASAVGSSTRIVGSAGSCDSDAPGGEDQAAP